MNWILLFEICYGIILALVCLRIIYDTRNSSKTVSYLLLAVFVPFGGMLFYFMFGINYRKRILYSKKLTTDEKRYEELNKRIIASTKRNLALDADGIGNEEGLVNLLLRDNLSPLTNGNLVKLLINGEEKFPEVIDALRSARKHIHLEYYIYENDIIGNMIKDVLIEKAREGVKVRFIYDDYGSRSIRKKLVKELREGGVEAYPFNRIRLVYFANRINYRNHRKMIIIDGKTGFTGGINVSDKYINKPDDKGKMYWRDTHLRIDGPGILILQHIFLCDWNFCSRQKLESEPTLFDIESRPGKKVYVQIASSGPDSPNSTIMLSLLRAITMAKKEILITTPYFIPGGSIMDGIKMASLGGVSVKVLVPGISDSKIVNAAARSYYGEMLRSGVEIYFYRKGFIHAKTMVIDNSFAVIGTANMNHRSFNLDFEVNAIIYNVNFSENVSKVFHTDILDAEKVSYDRWKMRPVYIKLAERIARLLSPVL
ncbi:MAG: cardiolipin synthase [Bacteroidales bacterium]|nr:cardiolipin synthase [Bacteroidales bacterium]